MGKIRKGTVLCLLLLLCGLPVRATAAGTVTVYMPVSGGSVTLYPVGQVTDEETVVLSEEFVPSGVTLTDPHDPEGAAQLAAFAKNAHVAGTVQPVTQDKSAVFSDLSEGLYLIVQQETPRNQLPIRPFLISIPEGECYAVEAWPKTQPEPEPTQPEGSTPKTGDRTALLLIPAVACMLFSGAGAFLCLYLYKDRRS